MNKIRTFSILGVRYNAPASLNENIRAWFSHNAPTADCDTIPEDADFTVIHTALSDHSAHCQTGAHPLITFLAF